MTMMTRTLKFDQQLWDARSAGYNAIEEDGEPIAENPYLASSPCAIAWFAGRAFGHGRVTMGRGYTVNVQIDNPVGSRHGSRVETLTWDDVIAAAATPKRMRIAYLHGQK